MLGNHACALGAIYAGCKFFAAYPITPQSEIAEEMSRLLPKVGGIFIQMEDELASICATIGASLTGLKAMTATSGPGFSLMQEGIGYAIATETPCVIVNVQRVGPSTGSIFGQQGDIMQARWGTHGGIYEIIALSPSSVQDLFNLTIQAFNLSEEYRVPVIVLSEASVSHLRETLKVPDINEINLVNRKLATCDPNEYKPFEAPLNECPPMAILGSGYKVYYTGHLHTEEGHPVLSLVRYHLADKVWRRLSNKIKSNIDKIIRLETKYIEDAEIIVIAYGMSARAALKAVMDAREMGIKAGMLRLITIWPFHDSLIRKLCASARSIIVAEVNNGQILYEVKRAVNNDQKVIPLLKLVDTHTPDEILLKIKEVA